MARILIADPAQVDLNDITNFIGIELRSPMAARRFVDEIHEKFGLYALHPDLGELRPELGAVRCFPFRARYVVVYRPLEDGIDVLRVLHGGKDYATLFPEA